MERNRKDGGPHTPKKKRGCYTSLYDWYDRAKAVQGVEIPFGFFASPDANMYRREMMRYVIRRLFPFRVFSLSVSCVSACLGALVVGSRCLL
jgi:hypothetical protein